MGTLVLNSLNDQVIATRLTKIYVQALDLPSGAWQARARETLESLRKIFLSYSGLRSAYAKVVEQVRQDASQYFVDSSRNLSVLNGVASRIKAKAIEPSFDLLAATREELLLVKIVDHAKAGIGDSAASIANVQDAIRTAFARKRMEEAESLYLTPIGWDITRFNNEGSQQLPDFEQIKAKVNDYALNIQLLVAGFDGEKGYIFSLHGYGDKRGLPQRSDIPGFDAIGSGSTVALFMLYYRDMSPGTGVREAIYYVLEAKYFAEQASGVGASTDLFIARAGKELIQINDEEVIEEKLIPICHAMSPNLLRPRDYVALNSLPGLELFPEAKRQEKKKKPKPQKAPSPNA